MKYHEYEPHPILRDSVKCFWIHEGSSHSDAEQDIEPDGCVELIFNFGSPYLLRTTSPPTPLPEAIIVGFQNKTLPILVRGTVKVVAARLFVWGALALLQDDTGSLANTVTPLGEGWSALVQRLREHATQGRYDEARTTLEDFLVQQAVARTYDPKLVQTAAKFLHRTKGQFRITDLADACDSSVRQLERGFHRAVGVTPKTFARTLRFVEAQRRLMFEPEADLTALAYDCGFSDQAHFIKEFKAFTGKTPGEYARRMRKFQEILKNRDVVFLQSNAGSDG